MRKLVLLSMALQLFFTPLAFAGDDEPEPEISYYKLKPSIVSNLNGGPKYIRCDIQLMTEYPENVAKLELHTPAIRHELLMLMIEQDGKVLKTPDGKEALRKAALEAIRNLLKERAGKTLVEDLYFTTFYVK